MIVDAAAARRALRFALALPLQDASRVIARVAPYLITEIDKSALAFIQAHLSKHGALPHPDTVTEKTGAPLPTSKETADYEIDLARKAFIEQRLRDAVEEASLVLNQSQDPDGALSLLTHHLLSLSQGHGTTTVTDLRDVETGALKAYLDALSGKTPPLPKTGWPTLDAKGGMRPGDMLALIGRPGVGKTWKMLRLAVWAWAEYGEPTMIVTQEMTAEAMEARILPFIAGVPFAPFYSGAPIQAMVGGINQAQYIAKLQAAAKELREAAAPLLIYDTRMAGTVADVEAVATMHGIKRVLIDGAYLLGHPDRRLNRYAKVSENLDAMKNWCQRSGTSLYTSWQFKRNSGKQSAEDEPDLDDIGYSHAVGEYATIVLACTAAPKALNLTQQRRISVMKGRNGETGSFDVRFTFDGQHFFEEIEAEESQADLEHL